MSGIYVESEYAGYLALALGRLWDYLATNGYPPPPGLVELEARLTRAAKGERDDSRGRASPLVSPSVTSGGGDDEDSGHGTCTQRDAARRLGVSPRTVMRMLDRGELVGPIVGGRRRVAVASLEQLLKPTDVSAPPSAGWSPASSGGGRAPHLDNEGGTA